MVRPLMVPILNKTKATCRPTEAGRLRAWKLVWMNSARFEPRETYLLPLILPEPL